METFRDEDGDAEHGMMEIQMVGRMGDGWLVRSIGLRWR
jgi:hypothetical protein